MDYFYQDQLRWNFGFENPNHAAALIASLLPFLWLLGRLWHPPRKQVRLLWQFLTASALLSGWGLLSLTLSRSGLVAALAAFTWIGIRTWKDWKRQLPGMAGIFTLGLVIIIATNLLPRAARTLVHPDASAMNRLTVWRGGLEILAIAPQGVGAGQSGAFFMNWLQPLHAVDGYRTLINSYLTFAAERGLPATAGLLFLFFVLLGILRSTKPKEQTTRDTLTACDSSLIAFLVAGLFSSTMETPWVWVGPIISFGILTAVFLWGKIPGNRIATGMPPTERVCVPRTIVLALISSLTAVGALWGIGKTLQMATPLEVRYQNESVTISKKTATPDYVLQVIPDKAVMGEFYGKGLRRVLDHTSLTGIVTGRDIGSLSHGTLTGGDQDQPTETGNQAVLLAPARVSVDIAVRAVERRRHTHIFLPGYDEDERCAFWREIAAKFPEKVSVITLPGFGNDLSEAWTDISYHLRDEFSLVKKEGRHLTLSR